MEQDKMMKEGKPEMMHNQLLGKVMNDEPGECAIMTLISNKQKELTDDLYDAKLKFADATLDRDNWSMAKEREITCNVIKGQISLLGKLKKDFEDMFTSTKSMVMAQ